MLLLRIVPEAFRTTVRSASGQIDLSKHGERNPLSEAVSLEVLSRIGGVVGGMFPEAISTYAREALPNDMERRPPCFSGRSVSSCCISDDYLLISPFFPPW